jgi:formamidase
VTVHVRVDSGKSILVDPASSHNRIWPDLPAVATVDPGEELIVDLRDGMDGQLDRDSDSSSLETVELGANHPLTGPIEVRGARPGDLLVVEIESVEPGSFGTSAILPGFGLLTAGFDRPVLVRWEIEDGVARSADLPGIAIRGRPFLGCVGVAPSWELFDRASAREEALAKRGAVVLGPEAPSARPAIEPYASRALRTIPPRENGGNLDVPQACAGSRVLLPVHMPGAMLSLGDAHFAQGEGEVCGTAIEVAATATLRVSLRPAEELRWRPTFPAIEFSEPALAAPRPCFLTMGIPVDDAGENADMDFTLAARRALGELVDWLEAERRLTREQAFVLASVAADLRVAEAVNVPNGLVVCRLPLDVFEANGAQ